MRKILSLFMTLLLMLSVVGCTDNKEKGDSQKTPSSSDSSQGQEQDEDTLTFDAKEMTVYIRMMESQDKWFRENIIKKFEQLHGVKINVRTFENVVDLQQILELDKENTIGLVKTGDSMVTPLAKKGFMMRLNEIDGVDVASDLGDYLEEAVALGTIDGEPYYIPRKLETNTLLYLKSAVEDAVANWEPMKDAIQAMFKAENGFGLPSDYTLEADPNAWDWYDLAVAGYYWANTEMNGMKEPRIAHRGKDYAGTTTELVTKAFQAGASQEEVLHMTGQGIVDAYEWEVFMKENGLYNPGMWEEGWSGGGIWKAMAAGKVYLAFMHQIDAFFIHGGTDPSMTGYLANPDDMGVAIMPAGASLDMADGKPARMGKHASQLGGWWWGIPKSTPDAKLSYALARFITNAENHKAEASTFGMMPVRKDIMDDLGSSFEEDWIKDVFQNAVKQINSDVTPLPTDLNWPEIAQLYNDAWFDIVVSGNHDNVQSQLETYTKKAADILKK